MFQTEWNGISLVEIAQQLGLPLAKLANHDVYAAFYRRLSERHFSLSSDWLDSKKRSSERLRIVFDEASASWREQGRVALAVGAGLGVVELPLIAAGYRIHLQECQEQSLRYFEEHTAIPAEKIYLGPDLSQVPSSSYDAVYFSQVIYAYDQSGYARALADAFRILRPGGLLALWDPECPFSAVVNRLRRSPHLGIFWGWVRSRQLHLWLAQRVGFRPIRRRALSSGEQPLDARARRLLGCTLPGNEAVTQELVYIKP